MSDNANFNRLSTYVGGIVDRKIKSISMAVTGSGSYLRILASQAQGYANDALGYVNVTAGHAADAAASASSSLIVWNNFTSTYLGVAASDPTVSQTGASVSLGAFYIRSADRRLRVVTSLASNGAPNWADATVAADLSSLGTAGNGLFLSLGLTSQQSVTGPVNFQNTVTVPRVTSWSSQQPAAAVDVNDRINAVNTAITNEVNRATGVENGLNTSKVSKTGDTMSGTLSVVANGEISSVIIRNNNSIGRQFRLHSTNDGRFRIVDDTSSAEVLSIATNGNVSIPSGINSGSLVSASSYVSNSNISTDPYFSLQTNSVTRWQMARSAGSSRFYVARFNSSGVFIDTPLDISESDGTVSLNRTIIRDTLTTNGNIRTNAVGASTILNNTSGNNDTTIDYKHLGTTRWIAGRSGNSGVYYVNRFNNAGTFVDTPLYIRDDNGLVVLNSLFVNTTINASTSISAPVIYATANANGQALRIGDDAWIGDGNIGNGLSIRGVADFNAGFVRFGNSNAVLGCNSNDSTLKYGGNDVYHSGNLTPNAWGYNFGTTNGVDWSTRPAGNGKLYVTMSGYMTFNNQRVGQTVVYPFTLQQVMTYNCSNVVPNTTQDFDQLGQFVGVPGNTQVTVVMQETGGNARYPIGVRWVVEGIIA